MAKLAIFGSSHVSRLESFCDRNGLELEVPFLVRFIGQGGLKAGSTLSSSKMRELLEFQPDIVIVIIGGNDINDDCSPYHVFENICMLEHAIKRAGTKNVYICEILHRNNFKKAPGMTEERYKTIKNVINKKLGKEFGNQCIRLKDLRFPHHFAEDCVHLNDQGQKKLFHVIRRFVCAVKL